MELDFGNSKTHPHSDFYDVYGVCDAYDAFDDDGGDYCYHCAYFVHYAYSFCYVYLSCYACWVNYVCFYDYQSLLFSFYILSFCVLFLELLKNCDFFVDFE